jgi:hypothetical protein
MDCGLITNKPRGSYAKVPANRYARSNLGRSLRSDGPDQIGAWGGGGRSPDLSKLGFSWVKSTRFRVWGDLRGTCSPPGAFAGLGEVRGGASKGGGGSTRWRITSARGCVVLGLAQGCKACARALCSTGEPECDSCRAVRGCRRPATASSRCGGDAAPACRCSGAWGALPTLIASAKGSGGRGIVHRGSGSGWVGAQGRRRRVQRRRGMKLVVRAWRAPPVSGSTLAASWGSCEHVQGVKKARRWPAASNRGGGSTYRGGNLGEIPVRA